jgi:hypothetical protein
MHTMKMTVWLMIEYRRSCAIKFLRLKTSAVSYQPCAVTLIKISVISFFDASSIDLW